MRVRMQGLPKRICLLIGFSILITMLLWRLTGYRPSRLFQYAVCYGKGLESFQVRMKQDFIVGSSYFELAEYLEDQGFIETQQPDKRFVFILTSGLMGECEGIVLGTHDDLYNIVDITHRIGSSTLFPPWL